jgi:hypothetical protein
MLKISKAVCKSREIRNLDFDKPEPELENTRVFLRFRAGHVGFVRGFLVLKFDLCSLARVFLWLRAGHVGFIRGFLRLKFGLFSLARLFLCFRYVLVGFVRVFLLLKFDLFWLARVFQLFRANHVGLIREFLLLKFDLFWLARLFLWFRVGHVGFIRGFPNLRLDLFSFSRRSAAGSAFCKFLKQTVEENPRLKVLFITACNRVLMRIQKQSFCRLGGSIFLSAATLILDITLCRQ